MIVTSTPIIGIAGKAGSGKDTVGTFLAQAYNGVCVGQADRMKRFLAALLDWNEDQLWGPSELRSTVCKINRVEAVRRLHERHEDSNLSLGEAFVESVVPIHRQDVALTRLMSWVHDLGEELSPRSALQPLGTEWGRHISMDMWNLDAIFTCKTLLKGGWNYTRTRGLFKDEGAAFDYSIITDIRFRNEILNVRSEGGVVLRLTRQDLMKAGFYGHKSETEIDSIPPHFYSRTLSNDLTVGDLLAKVAGVMRDSYGDNRLR